MSMKISRHHLAIKIGFLMLCNLIALQSYGQQYNVELRPTLHFPTRTVLDQNLRIGNGIELTGVYNVSNRTSVYAGLLWNRFDTDESRNEEDIEYTQKGIVLGTLFNFKIIEKQKHLYYIRTGFTYSNVASSSVIETANFESKNAIGTQLGLGMSIKSLGHWSILPELRYSSSSHRKDVTSGNDLLSFNTIAITVAIRRSL